MFIRGVLGIGGRVGWLIRDIMGFEGLGDLRVVVVVFLSISGIILLFIDRMGINCSWCMDW